MGDHPQRIRHLDDLRHLKSAVTPCRINDLRVFRRTLTNGWIKHVLGFRRFSLRGLAKVRCEWDLVCLALNVKRLHVLMAA